MWHHPPHSPQMKTHTAPLPPPRAPVASDTSPAGTFVKGEGRGDWGPREPGALVMWQMTPTSAGDSVGAGLDNSLSPTLPVCVFSVHVLYFY